MTRCPSIRPAAWWWLACLPGLSGAADAADATPDPALFRGADLVLGQRLVAEHRCSQCHAQRVGGDGSAIYRPKGRVNHPAALRAMVERCETQLGLQWFPEDVTAVAAWLNRQHYHFR